MEKHALLFYSTEYSVMNVCTVHKVCLTVGILSKACALDPKPESVFSRLVRFFFSAVKTLHLKLIAPKSPQIFVNQQ